MFRIACEGYFFAGVSGPIANMISPSPEVPKDVQSEATPTAAKAETPTIEAKTPAAEIETPMTEAEISTTEAEKSTAVAEKSADEAETPAIEAKTTAAEAEKFMTEAEKSTAEAEKSTAEAEKSTAEAEKSTAEAEKSRPLAEKSTAQAEKSTAVAEQCTALADKSTAVGEKSRPLAEKSTAVGDKSTAEISTAEADKSTAETLGSAQGGPEAADAAPMSKRAQKRLLKRQQWLAERPQRRVEERAYRKTKMEAKKRENHYEMSYSQSRKKLKEAKMSESACQVGVVVDMSFGHLMHQRDLGKCCKQLLHCYSMNRRLANPMQFYVTSMIGASLDEMKKHQGFENWDAHIKDEHYADVLEQDKIVYLSSESDNVIQTLEPNRFYIIGGLVDHNHHKGLCHRLAVEKGFQHGRLPIDEYLDLKTRKVLTIDHVFKILTSVSEGSSWKEAFLSVLPSRKGAIEKDETEAGASDSPADEQKNE